LRAVFTANCGSCHTLAKAGTSGSVGPNLDDVGLDAEQVQAIVRSGAGVMPSFSDKLSDAEITGRLREYRPPAPSYTNGVMGKYAKLVSSASEGAVTR